MEGLAGLEEMVVVVVVVVVVAMAMAAEGETVAPVQAGKEGEEEPEESRRPSCGRARAR
jgi:hypothetical protein